MKLSKEDQAQLERELSAMLGINLRTGEPLTAAEIDAARTGTGTGTSTPAPSKTSGKDKADLVAAGTALEALGLVRKSDLASDESIIKIKRDADSAYDRLRSEVRAGLIELADALK